MIPGARPGRIDGCFPKSRLPARKLEAAYDLAAPLEYRFGATQAARAVAVPHDRPAQTRSRLRFAAPGHADQPGRHRARCAAPADIDETPKRGELPRACANRLARAKAEAALELVSIDEELNGAYILSADTVVAVGRRILPKADLLDEAAQCLRLLSGRNHRVHTAVCLVTPTKRSASGWSRPGAVQAALRRGHRGLSRLRRMARQGRRLCGARHCRRFIVKLVGSYSNVVGLPLYETTKLLLGEGYPIRFGWLNAV